MSFKSTTTLVWPKSYPLRLKWIPGGTSLSLSKGVQSVYGRGWGTFVVWVTVLLCPPPKSSVIQTTVRGTYEFSLRVSSYHYNFINSTWIVRECYLVHEMSPQKPGGAGPSRTRTGVRTTPKSDVVFIREKRVKTWNVVCERNTEWPTFTQTIHTFIVLYRLFRYGPFVTRNDTYN